MKERKIKMFSDSSVNALEKKMNGFLRGIDAAYIWDIKLVTSEDMKIAFIYYEEEE